MSIERELLKHFSRLKLLDIDDPNMNDVVYNLNCLLGYFYGIDHIGAANTVYCAEQIIKREIEIDNDDKRGIPRIS